MNMYLMRWGCYTDLGASSSREAPADAVQLVRGRSEDTEAIRVRTGTGWTGATEGEEPVDDAVDGLCSRVAVVVGDGEEDPAVRGGDDENGADQKDRRRGSKRRGRNW